MKYKVVFFNFQEFLVSKNCLRSKTTPSTRTAIKRGLSRNFTKTLKSRHFMGHIGTGLKFLTTTDMQIFRTFFVQSFKNMSKISIAYLSKICLFSNFLFYSKGCQFSVIRFNIVIFRNILLLEMNIRNFY